MASLKEHIKTFVKLNVFALGILHISNRFISSFSRSGNTLSSAAEKFYRWKYGDIFYRKAGEGSPIILLHDLNPSFSSHVWNEVIDDLSKNHTVYSIDLPGCGKSAKIKSEYTNYFFVLFLRDFIKEVVKSRSDILADGYSSSFALMTSLDGDSIIGNIYAVNPLSVQELSSIAGPKEKLARTLVSSPVIGTTIYNMEMSRSNIDLAFTEKYLYNPFRSRDRYVESCYEAAHCGNGSGKYLLASLRGKYTTVDIQKALEKKADSFTILYGTKTGNGEAILKSYRKINQDINGIEIEQTKYLPQLERPEYFMEAFETAEKSAEK